MPWLSHAEYSFPLVFRDFTTSLFGAGPPTIQRPRMYCFSSSEEQPAFVVGKKRHGMRVLVSLACNLSNKNAVIRHCRSRGLRVCVHDSCLVRDFRKGSTNVSDAAILVLIYEQSFDVNGFLHTAFEGSDDGLIAPLFERVEWNDLLQHEWTSRGLQFGQLEVVSKVLL